MSVSPALMERVDAGLEWADENIPDWRDYVDPAKLNMGDGELCFLGQYWNGKWGSMGAHAYYRAARAFFGNDLYDLYERAQKLGFATNTWYTELNAAWQQKFREIGHGSEA